MGSPVVLMSNCVPSNNSVLCRFQNILFTESWTDYKDSSVLIVSPVPVLSGEWPGDEEVDG